MDNYLLYGSGGHAKVVLECLASEGKSVCGFFDDNPKEGVFKSVPILGVYDESLYPKSSVIITIGSNQIRKKLSQKIVHSFGSTIFKNSTVSPQATLGKGSMVLQGAILHADSVVGNHVIVNTRAIVEHDCIVGDFVHLAPGSAICGHSQIGEGTLIGANAVVAPHVKIGKWCQISAGSSVLEDVPDFSLVMGVPGKVIKPLKIN